MARQALRKAILFVCHRPSNGLQKILLSAMHDDECFTGNRPLEDFLQACSFFASLALIQSYRRSFRHMHADGLS